MEDEKHCSNLGVNALRKAIDNYYMEVYALNIHMKVIVKSNTWEKFNG